MRIAKLPKGALALKRTIIQQRFASILKSLVLVGISGVCSQAIAGEPHQWFAGTYLDPAIQRYDFFPHTISRSIPEYRQVYNRPRNLTGWIAYKIEPSSQEAMAWQTNHCNGNYQNHAGAYVPMYCYPKPWESLNTRGRPGMNNGLQVQREPVETVPVETIPVNKLKVIPERSPGVEVPTPGNLK